MSSLYHPLVLSFIVGVAVFICSYKWSDKILDFFSKKTLGSQKEILDIMEKLLITKDKKKVVFQYWIFSLALSFLVFILFWPKIIFGFILGLATLVLTWIGVRNMLRATWESHCNRVVDQLVESLTIMSNSLKVGLGLTQAMKRVIEGHPGPLAKEFRLVLNKVKLGQSIEEAITELGERVNRAEIDMLVTAINILKETGGNLAETFFIMAETTRERQKMEKKIKALTAQGIIQAKIISAIPFVLFGTFWVMNPDYIAPLLFQPLGQVCLGVVIILVFYGSYTMKKMVEIKI